MLEIRTSAELKKVTCRTETSNHNLLRALDIDLVATGLEADVIDGFIEGFQKRFYEDQQPAAQELYPLKVRHVIPNVMAKLSRIGAPVEFRSAVVANIELTPQPARICDIKLRIKATDYANGFLDKLTTWTRGTVELELIERQLSLLPSGEPEEAEA